MSEVIIGALSTLAGTALGGAVTYGIMLRQHRHENEKDRKAVAREKLELAIASAERIALCLKRVQRIHFDLQQLPRDLSTEQISLSEYMRMKAEARADMEESLLKLRTYCAAYFNDNDVLVLMKQLEEMTREAYASAARQESLDLVEQSVKQLETAMILRAKEYEG